MSSANISSLSSTLTLLHDKISFSFGLVSLIFGVLGGFLNILLFSRRHFRTVSCCTYFLGASMAMLILMSMSAGTLIYAAHYANPINNISVYCKVWYYLQQSNAMLFRWLLAAACLDRYALSSTNARLRRFASAHIARRFMAIIVLIWLVFPIPVLVLYDVRAGGCIIVYGYAAALYIAIFTIINAYAIPVTIMVACALLIRRNLANKRERRQFNIDRQQRVTDREHPQRRQDQQALVMLFSQIFVYIILTTPWVIFSIYNAISVNFPNKSAERLTIERFEIFLAGVVALLFPTASFYLHTLTSSVFRKELFVMLRSIPCFKCCIDNRRVEPIITNIPLRPLTVQ